jgi:uncharacterized membrane protein
VKTKITQFSFFANLWQPFIASAIMGVAVYYLQNYFILIPVLAGVIVYAVVLLILGFFKREDYDFVKSQIFSKLS